MQYFTSVHDVPNVRELLNEAQALKQDLYAYAQLGKNKTLGLVFMNPSLRTRLSTQKAANNLGMNCMVLNMNQDSWALEFEDGSIMNSNRTEHVKDAAAILSLYCDIIGIRCFPSLTDREFDYSELILEQFKKYCTVPVVSLESATRHPLQSFADLITINENWNKTQKPRVVLTWAPHVKALPQAVANSFSEWMCQSDVDLVLTHPHGMELHSGFTKGATIEYDQNRALKDADFVYVKNWSSYEDYGNVYSENQENWLLTERDLAVTNNAGIMHCLPVRRNVELSDSLLDGPNSMVLQQAENRIYAAQTVLKKMLETLL